MHPQEELLQLRVNDINGDTSFDGHLEISRVINNLDSSSFSWLFISFAFSKVLCNCFLLTCCLLFFLPSLRSGADSESIETVVPPM